MNWLSWDCTCWCVGSGWERSGESIVVPNLKLLHFTKKGLAHVFMEPLAKISWLENVGTLCIEGFSGFPLKSPPKVPWLFQFFPGLFIEFPGLYYTAQIQYYHFPTMFSLEYAIVHACHYTKRLYFYFNASTFASVVRQVFPSAAARSRHTENARNNKKSRA